MSTDLEALHQRAEALVAGYKYMKPEKDIQVKGLVRLGRGEIIRAQVQIVKKNGGENNLHYHSRVETFWWVIKGRMRFYGPQNALLAECGPSEGIITPRYSRNWFENCGDEDLELLQIAASDGPNHESGRTDVEPRRRPEATIEGDAGVPPQTVGGKVALD